MEAATVFAPLHKLRDELRGEVAKLKERCREREEAMAMAAEEARGGRDGSSAPDGEEKGTGAGGGGAR
jgi:hypothetical protein